MNKINWINSRQVLLIILLVFALALSYLAGAISVEARWFEQNETRATTDQIAAISAAVSLLLLGNGQGESLFLPLILK
jgi:hypothetical protein